MKLVIYQCVNEGCSSFLFQSSTLNRDIQYFESFEYESNVEYFKRNRLAYTEAITILPLDNLEEV